MRISQPTGGSDLLPYSSIRLDGCSDSIVGFTFLSEQPEVGKRRYCNKVLVHECISASVADPIALTKAEFIATDDPCYTFFNVFKSSEVVDEIDPTIDIQTNIDGDAVGVLVNFAGNETCCIPLSMAYKIYGYNTDGRILLSHGTLFVSPCSCTELSEPPSTSGVIWTGVMW